MTKAEESGQKGPRAVEDCWSGFQRLNHDSLSHVSHVSHVYVYMSNRQRYIVILIQSCFACNLPHLCGAGPHVPLPHAGHWRFRWGAQGTSSWFCLSMESNLKMAIFSGKKTISLKFPGTLFADISRCFIWSDPVNGICVASLGCQ